MSDIATKSQTQKLLNEYNLTAKKNYGQNFLVDNNIVKNIVKKAGVTKKINVIEIGPGIGGLSQELAFYCKKLVCIEIDERFKAILQNNLSDFNNVELIFADFLSLDLKKLIHDNFERNEEIIIVANLPYYITTAILIKIFEEKDDLKITKICAMMQKEVGLRLSAQKDTKDYNSLTVLTQYYCDTKIIMKVSKNVFIPEPKVDSVVVSFDFKLQNNKPLDEAFFFKLIRILFKQRRKTILNNLTVFTKDKEALSNLLLKINLSANLRAENLSLADIIILSDLLVEEGYND